MPPAAAARPSLPATIDGTAGAAAAGTSHGAPASADGHAAKRARIEELLTGIAAQEPALCDVDREAVGMKALVYQLGLTAAGLFRDAGCLPASVDPAAVSLEQEEHLLRLLAAVCREATKQKIADAQGPLTREVLLALIAWGAEATRFHTALSNAVTAAESRTVPGSGGSSAPVQDPEQRQQQQQQRRRQALAIQQQQARARALLQQRQLQMQHQTMALRQQQQQQQQQQSRLGRSMTLPSNAAHPYHQVQQAQAQQELLPRSTSLGGQLTSGPMPASRDGQPHHAQHQAQLQVQQQQQRHYAAALAHQQQQVVVAQLRPQAVQRSASLIQRLAVAPADVGSVIATRYPLLPMVCRILNRFEQDAAQVQQQCKWLMQLINSDQPPQLDFTDAQLVEAGAALLQLSAADQRALDSGGPTDVFLVLVALAASHRSHVSKLAATYRWARQLGQYYAAEASKEQHCCTPGATGTARTSRKVAKPPAWVTQIKADLVKSFCRETENPGQAPSLQQQAQQQAQPQPTQLAAAPTPGAAAAPAAAPTHQPAAGHIGGAAGAASSGLAKPEWVVTAERRMDRLGALLKAA